VKTYAVSWEIEMDADSPEDAARKCLAIMRDHESSALVFQMVEEAAPDAPGRYPLREFVVDLWPEPATVREVFP